VDPFGLTAKDCTKTGLRWNDGELGENDLNFRGTGKTQKDALDEAFKRTGYSKEQFEVTEWAKDQNGKSFSVEWRGPNGAEVNIDKAHYKVDKNGNWKTGPDAPHVGWQVGRKNKTVGHILLDEVTVHR